MVKALTEFDVIIVGGGIVGATTACLLAQHCGQVALIDHGEPVVWQTGDPFDLRASAINLASIKLFQELEVWSQIESMRMFPYIAMQVWEQNQGASISFKASDTSHSKLGAIVENQVLLAALNQRLAACANVARFDRHSLLNVSAIGDASMLVELDDATKLSAKLVLGADGQHSRVRECVGISVSTQAYNQMGIVCNIETEDSHQATAWQCFTQHGPLALLPLAEQQCSIVWSVPETICDELLALDENAFNAEISTAFEHKLGALRVISERKSFPLKGAQADRYIEHRVALLGDAAHTVHPLAGLGLNLGLEDARVLADLIITSSRPLGSERVLRQYERARASENALMQRSLEFIDELFSKDYPHYQQGRAVGFALTDKFLPLKSLFMQRALGVPI